MNIEHRAARYAALGDPVRLFIADALRAGDRTPASLCAEMSISSNLLAHHTKILEAAGLVIKVPSEADRRRVYLHLTDIGSALLEPSPVQAKRVLFVCTHNSARSQFAEVLWREVSEIPVESAGTEPSARVHPMAVRVAHGRGLNLDGAAPKGLTDGAVDGALVVTVCDSADEQLQPSRVPHLHWSVPDPVAQAKRRAFDRAFDDIAERIGRLADATRTQESR